jgi:predicted dienelactone hydrolase
MRYPLLTLVVACAFFVGAPSHGVRADEFGAGFLHLKLTDPVEGGPMPAIVFYPTRPGGGSTEVGPFTIAATRGAAPASGAYPLIVHSHGTGGTHLGHHDTLAALARAGFVAAAVQHPRDNFLDSSGFATDLQLIGRPHHIVALIDGALGNATVGPRIDRSRIGMAGFSAGGYTALLVAGAVPNFSLAAEYRRAVPIDALRQRADAAPKGRQKPGLEFIADPRVRAIFLMAPALGYVFDREALANVNVPVRLYRPAADEVLVHPWNAERVAQMLPKPPEYHVIEKAGHYVFLAPCSVSLAQRVPEICADPPGVDRAASHGRLNAEMIEFFRRTLGSG